MNFTADYDYYRAAGASLDLVDACRKDRARAHSEAWKITNEVGATGAAWKGGRLYAFAFRDGEVPEAWVSAGRSLSDTALWKPGNRRKAHKALRARMAEVDQDAPLRDLTRTLTGHSSVLSFSAMVITNRWVSWVVLDNVTIIGVPRPNDGDAFAPPPDAEPLALSECWRLKEEHDAAEAA